MNTIGNVPLSWYDEFDHVGYDIDGQKIMRGTKKDELDHLIARFDDPNASRTIHDALHGVDVVLSDDDLKLIRRLQKRRYAHDGVEAYPAPVEFEWKDSLHPMSSATPAKAPFLPSKWEAKKVMRLVMAMRSEQYQKAVANRKAQDEKARASYEYLIWDEPPPDAAKARRRLPAPKLALPGNAESYNPPSEYLFTDEERQTWERMDPSDRPLDFVPQRYASLRRVPLYAPLIKERFERCLDLYLCPREARSRLDIDPDSLIPQMPKPAELRPFPERLSLAYKGHEGRVRALSVSPSGQHLLSSAADGTVRLWEVSSGRCLKVFAFGGEVASVAWCPDADADLAAAVVANKLLLFYPASTPGHRAERAREVLEGEAAAAAAAEGDAEAGRRRRRRRRRRGRRRRRRRRRQRARGQEEGGGGEVGEVRGGAAGGGGGVGGEPRQDGVSRRMAPQGRLPRVGGARRRVARGAPPPDLAAPLGLPLRQVEGTRRVRRVPSLEAALLRRDAAPRPSVRRRP